MPRHWIVVLALTSVLGAGAVAARFRPGSAMYRSGSMTYREQLREGRLVALPLDSAKESGNGVSAFELRIRTAPSGPELDLTKGWRWAGEESELLLFERR